MVDAQGALPTGTDKRTFVREMFDSIAPRYDLVNGLITFGLDSIWRRTAIRLLSLGPGALVADVGCGTGDLARALVRRGYRAVGIDLSIGMLKYGDPGGAPLVQSDAAMLPLHDSAVDGVVSGFAIRNFSDLPGVTVELARVVRPGGRIALLEVAEPSNWIIRKGHSIWFNRVVPQIGGLFSDAAAYRYLPRSVTYLPIYAQLAAMLGDAGFTGMRRDLLSGGVAQVITATRAGMPRVTVRPDALSAHL